MDRDGCDNSESHGLTWRRPHDGYIFLSQAKQYIYRLGDYLPDFYLFFNAPLTARLVIETKTLQQMVPPAIPLSCFLCLPSSPRQISINKVVVVVFKFFVWRKGTLIF